MAKNISPSRKNEKEPELIPLSGLMMTRSEVITLDLGKWIKIIATRIIYYKQAIKGGIIISSIEIYISHDVPTEFFRNLIVDYPLGTYNKTDDGLNWFTLTVESETFDSWNGKRDTIEVRLKWIANKDDKHLMDDYHADPANYTP